MISEIANGRKDSMGSVQSREEEFYKWLSGRVSSKLLSQSYVSVEKINQYYSTKGYFELSLFEIDDINILKQVDNNIVKGKSFKRFFPGQQYYAHLVMMHYINYIWASVSRDNRVEKIAPVNEVSSNGLSAVTDRKTSRTEFYTWLQNSSDKGKADFEIKNLDLIDSLLRKYKVTNRPIYEIENETELNNIIDTVKKNTVIRIGILDKLESYINALELYIEYSEQNAESFEKELAAEGIVSTQMVDKTKKVETQPKVQKSISQRTIEFIRSTEQYKEEKTKFMAWLKKEGYSAVTINIYTKALERGSQYALSNGLINTEIIQMQRDILFNAYETLYRNRKLKSITSFGPALGAIVRYRIEEPVIGDKDNKTISGDGSQKNLADSEKEVESKPNAEFKKEKIDAGDSITQKLTEQKIGFIDKRKEGDKLYIVRGEKADEIVDEFKMFGIEFEYKSYLRAWVTSDSYYERNDSDNASEQDESIQIDRNTTINDEKCVNRSIGKNRLIKQESRQKNIESYIESKYEEPAVDDSIAAYLYKSGIQFEDKRGKGGALFLENSPETEYILTKIRSMGISVLYSIKRGQWYIKEKYYEKDEVGNETHKKEEGEREQSTNYKYAVDFSKQVDYSFTKPVSVSFMGKKIIESSWRKVYISVCQDLIRHYPVELKMIRNRNGNGVNNLIFSKYTALKKLTNPVCIGGDCYVETNRNATALIKNLKLLLDFCNVNYKDVEILYIRADQENSGRKDAITVKDSNQNSSSKSKAKGIVKVDKKFGYSALQGRAEFTDWLKSDYKRVEVVNASWTLTKISELAIKQGIIADHLYTIRDPEELTQIFNRLEMIPAYRDFKLSNTYAVFAINKYIEFRKKQKKTNITNTQITTGNSRVAQTSQNERAEVIKRETKETISTTAASTRKPLWNPHEAAILLEATVQVYNDELDRKKAVSYVSKALRCMARREGLEIDNVYRNEAGITFQMYGMESAYLGYVVRKHPASKLFHEIAELRRTDREAYEKLLIEAKSKITIDGSNEEYQVWLSGIEKKEESPLSVHAKEAVEDVSAIHKTESLDTYQSCKESEVSIYRQGPKHPGQKEFEDWLKKRGSTLSTIKSYSASVASIGRYLVDHELIARNIYAVRSIKRLEYIKNNLFNDAEYERCVGSDNTQIDYYALQKYITFRKNDSSDDAEGENEERYRSILRDNFENGFRTNSMIDRNRFKQFYSDSFKEDVQESDEEIVDILRKVGSELDNRIFFREANKQNDLLDDIQEEIAKVFNKGISCVYLSELYAEYQERLSSELQIFSAEVLKEQLLLTAYEAYRSTKHYFYLIDRKPNVSGDVEKLMKRSNVPLSYGDIYEKLRFIPLDTIKHSLVLTEKMVNVASETYFYAPNLPINAEELNQVASLIHRQLQQKSFITDSELRELISQECPSVAINTENFLTWGLRNALAVLLGNQFSFNGAIISERGEALNMSQAFLEFCQARDNMTMDELKQFAKEMNTIIYWDSVYSEMIRVSKDEFVSKKQIEFDINAIDGVLNELVSGEYQSLQSFTLFLHFPVMSVRWNTFVLESYAAGYSKDFTLMHASYTATECCGAVVRRDSNITCFKDLITDVLMKSNNWHSKDDALALLVRKGYLQRKRYSEIDAVIQDVNNRRIISKR